MLSAIPSQFQGRGQGVKDRSFLLILSLFFYSTPAQAQTGELLPPPITQNQQVLPQLEPAQTLPSGQYDYNSQTTNQTSTSGQYQYDYQNKYQNQYQNNQNTGRYLVIVDNSSSQILQQVKRIEPTAYPRSYQGRYIIQAGTFNKPDNAQRRLAELTSRGINGVRIVSSGSGSETPSYPDRGGYYPNRGGYYSDRGSSVNQRSNYYYVAIPANTQDLPFIEEKIRRNIGQRAAVLPRNQPRGPHIAVGPFPQRAIAEQWNSYLQSLGFGNARVYYGK